MIPTVNRNFITIVSGLPRSGTSLMMQILDAGGLPVLTDHVREADPDNPRGYLEFEVVKQLKRNKHWLSSARGKAVKVIHLLVPELPIENYSYRVILMRRRLAEIIASQRSMLKRQGRPGAGLDDFKLGQVFTAQMMQVESWMQQQPAFGVHSVNYNALILNPEEQVRATADFLGGGLDVNKMIRVVDPALYRQRC